ncbi:GTPase-activating protein [Tulasnella sp. UAMH 9824]|nr:GTPase-activating protein [Tulasnella sp. UAMH 9824]
MAIFNKKQPPEPPVEKAVEDGEISEKGTSGEDSNTKQTTPENKIPPVGFTELFRYSTKFELFLDFIGLVCAAASGASQPLMTLLFGDLTQSFVGFASALNSNDPAAIADARSKFRHDASQGALWLTVMGIGLYVVTHVYMLIWTWTGEVNSKRIREKYLRSVLRQDITFFDKLGAGEVTTRIQTDTHLVQQGISEKVPLIVMSIAAFLTGFVLAYARSWRLALALTSIIPCIVIAGGGMTVFETKYKEQALDEIATGGSLAEEVISTIRTAHAFGTQSTLSRLYDAFAIRARSWENKIAIVRGLGVGAMFFVVYASYALAFSFGTTLILQGRADAGLVVNVFFSIIIGAFSLSNMAPELQAVTMGQAAAAKLFLTIDRVPPIDSADEGGLKPTEIKGHITFENVVFNYPSRPDVPILKGFSLDIPPGTSAALVGASGSGKSTVVSLVERFYDPNSGTVKLDGVDIKQLNVKWLRQQIGLVQQEPSLFATTIRNNVAHGLIGSRFENETEEEKFQRVKEACVKANADSFIQKLPQGYDTLVGERGFLLSGGQKQRIAIARAIVSDPRILLLDEATSALDTQSEGLVQDALDKAAAGRTTITIAHRLSTIRDADQIYVVGKGDILEQGTHNQLLANPDGPYAQLVSAQKLKGQDPESRDSEAAEGGLMSAKEVEDTLAEEVPEALKRTGTGRSLASEALERKRLEQGEEKGPYGMVYLIKRMALLDREDRSVYIRGGIASICDGLTYPAFGIVFGKAMDAFALQDRRALRFEGDRVALWAFVISLISGFAVVMENFYFSRAAAGLTQKLRSLSFRAMLRQDIGWFDEDKHSSGRLVSILSDNPAKISGLAGLTLGAIIMGMATVVGGDIIGLIFAPKLGAVSIACTPFIISAGYIRLRVVTLKDQTNKAAHEESAQLACEAAGAIRTVQSLTREESCLHEYSRSLEEPLRRSNRTAIWSTGLFAVSQAMAFFAISLVRGEEISVRFVRSDVSGTFSFQDVLAVTFGAIQAGDMFQWVPDISAARGAMDSIVRLLDRVPEIDAESPGGSKIDSKTVQGRIQFEDVHFRYPTRPGVRVLRNLNLIVEPGTYVALVGASGCGKSTTIQLIERFYDPLAGRVLLDGVDIASLNIQEYRKNISLVSQEPTLYAGTIHFNILLGATKPSSEVTQEEIEQACRDANILEFIQSLPQGFDTEVGGKGSQLSGGQKQRIAIARALLRNPKVLLLDEATSALDSQSEKVVQAALDNAAKGRTTIAIAHRLSTIQNADRIYFIKEGRVSEVGTHQELLAKRGG